MPRKLIGVYEDNPSKQAPDGMFRLVSAGNGVYASLHFGDFLSLEGALDKAREVAYALVPGVKHLVVYDDDENLIEELKSHL